MNDMTMPMSAQPASHDAYEGVVMSVHHSDQERRRYNERRVNQAGMLELLDQTDIKHDEAHKRLRSDFRELEQQLIDGLKSLAEKQHEMNDRMTELATTPVDVTKLVLTPKIVVSIIFIVVGIAGGMWASTAGLRSELQVVSAKMTADQRVADERAQRSNDNNTVIKDALSNSSRDIKEQISAITKRQELQQLQIQAMQESIIRLTSQERR